MQKEKQRKADMQVSLSFPAWHLSPPPSNSWINLSFFSFLFFFPFSAQWIVVKAIVT
jgi:hypothetical protein